MAILTVSSYYPHMALPVYMRVEPTDHHNREVGETYDVEVEDEERSDGGPYNSAHKAELVAQRDMEWRDVSPMLLAYQGFARDKNKAVERVCAGDGEYEPDRGVSLLVFLRKDKAQDFITDGTDMIPGDFTKEDIED